ncbi:unnamed protein product [Ixodes hexagonus]
MVLAREGATVVIADRNRTGSAETLQMLQASHKGDHRAIHVDVSDSTAVSLLFEKNQVVVSWEKDHVRGQQRRHRGKAIANREHERRRL